MTLLECEKPISTILSLGLICNALVNYLLTINKTIQPSYCLHNVYKELSFFRP